MRAVVFEEVGKPLQVKEVSDPVPTEGQVVVKVSRCGICGSDLHMAEGHGYVPPNGTVFGHEFSGEIVELGKNVDGVKIADRIAVMPIFGCGQCVACRQGLPAQCTAMQFTAGGYGEYVAIDPSSAIKLPGVVSMEDGALAEPLAVALHGVSAAKIEPGDVVVVVGTGPIGLATLFWARRFGAARVYVIDKVPERCAIATAMGATAVHPPAPPAAGDGFARYFGDIPVPELADVVFECVGKPGLLMPSAAYARRGGKLVSMGYCFGDDPIIPAGLGLRELQLFFPQLYTRREFELSVNVLNAGNVEPRHMVTDTVGLVDVPGTFESLRTSPKQCKVMISPFA
jgi:(R,R)-butanediol dehydrogenase/meso-butanediol dehydrogenase/diacetyl reductase